MVSELSMDNRWNRLDEILELLKKAFGSGDQSRKIDEKYSVISEQADKNNESRGLLGPIPVTGSLPETTTELTTARIPEEFLDESQESRPCRNQFLDEFLGKWASEIHKNEVNSFLSRLGFLSLPSFSGINPVDWINGIEVYFDIYPSMNIYQFSLVEDLLVGRAKEWAASWSFDGNYDDYWNAFVDALCDRFENSDDEKVDESVGMFRSPYVEVTGSGLVVLDNDESNVIKNSYGVNSESNNKLDSEIVMKSEVIQEEGYKHPCDISCGKSDDSVNQVHEVTVQEDQGSNGDELEKVKITSLDMNEPRYVIESGRSFKANLFSRRYVSDYMISADMNLEMMFSVSSSSLYELITSDYIGFGNEVEIVVLDETGESFAKKKIMIEDSTWNGAQTATIFDCEILNRSIQSVISAANSVPIRNGKDDLIGIMVFDPGKLVNRIVAEFRVVRTDFGSDQRVDLECLCTDFDPGLLYAQAIGLFSLSGLELDLTTDRDGDQCFPLKEDGKNGYIAMIFKKLANQFVKSGIAVQKWVFDLKSKPPDITRETPKRESQVYATSLTGFASFGHCWNITDWSQANITGCWNIIDWNYCLDTHALRAASTSADFSTKLWDALIGNELHSFGHKHIVRAYAFSDNTPLLLTDRGRALAVAFLQVFGGLLFYVAELCLALHGLQPYVIQTGIGDKTFWVEDLVRDVVRQDKTNKLRCLCASWSEWLRKNTKWRFKFQIWDPGDLDVTNKLINMEFSNECAHFVAARELFLGDVQTQNQLNESLEEIGRSLITCMAIWSKSWLSKSVVHKFSSTFREFLCDAAWIIWEDIDLSLFVFICWSLWGARNEHEDLYITPKPDATLNKALLLLEQATVTRPLDILQLSMIVELVLGRCATHYTGFNLWLWSGFIETRLQSFEGAFDQINVFRLTLEDKCDLKGESLSQTLYQETGGHQSG